MSSSQVVQTFNKFDEKIYQFEGQPLHAIKIDTIQVNIGLACNLQCIHCHVSSSPRRKEEMQWDIMELILNNAEKVNAKEIDITGGAPEINPNLKRFITEANNKGFTTKVRTNLTILLEPGYEDYPQFFKDYNVQLIASLPCYLQENVDKQRGSGVYEGSIKAIKLLNEVGYGIEPNLPLYLVYNPVGPSLPPEQETLEYDYRRELLERFNIHFTNLLTITNMPIGRYRVDLRHSNKEKDYFRLLTESFNPDTLQDLMCRYQISVNWDGTLYDCDFHLAMRKPINSGVPNHISRFDEYLLAKRKIVTQDYCFGCTAGCGSSCGGALIHPETIAN